MTDETAGEVSGRVPRRLGAAEMLDLWEEGRGRSETHRALSLLSRSLPGAGKEALAALPVGTRDRLLMRLRTVCFGPEAPCVSTCPSCGETAEFDVALADLFAAAGETGTSTEIDWDGTRYRLRPVTSADLLALEGGLGDRIDALLARCASAEDGSPLPLEAAEAASEALAALDPAAKIELAASCPSCGTGWTSAFDIASYLWSEVEMAARRLLPEIHTLASAYGWSESAILALSPTRRQSYLALAGAR